MGLRGEKQFKSNVRWGWRIGEKHVRLIMGHYIATRSAGGILCRRMISR